MCDSDPFDSINSYVDQYASMGVASGVGYTLKPPATRRTARYGIRRPRHNTYASVIHSQAPVLPTDPTRVTPRKNCRRGAGDCAAANDVLESKELLCGDCVQPVRGPGQAAWVSAYDKRDELQQLLIDSEARDALIAKAYRELASQSYQTESKPVLCKALARLYQHGAHQPLRPSPHWSDEDWKVARWYSSNCYPYVAGNVAWTERPLTPKKWIDNVVKTLGPIYDYQSRACMCAVRSGELSKGRRVECDAQPACASCSSCTDPGVQACPCAPESGERGVYPRAPPSPASSGSSVSYSDVGEPAQCGNVLSNVQNCSGGKPTQNQLARVQRAGAQRDNRAWQTRNQAATLQHYTGNMPGSKSQFCAPQSDQDGPYDRAPHMRKFYGLQSDGASGDALRAEQARIVAEQRARLDAANPDYAERVYQAQVADHRSRSAQKQVRMSALMDPNVGAFNLPGDN